MLLVISSFINLICGIAWISSHLCSLHKVFEVDATSCSRVEVVLRLAIGAHLVLIPALGLSTSSDWLEHLSIEEADVTVSSKATGVLVSELQLTRACLEWHHKVLDLIVAHSSLLVDLLDQLRLLCILLDHCHTLFILLYLLLQPLNLFILLIALAAHGCHLGLAESVLFSKYFCIQKRFHVSIVLNNLHQSVKISL